MSFDQDPADIENYPCPKCGKPVYKSEAIGWTCSECPWVADTTTQQATAKTDAEKESGG